MVSVLTTLQCKSIFRTYNATVQEVRNGQLSITLCASPVDINQGMATNRESMNFWGGGGVEYCGPLIECLRNMRGVPPPGVRNFLKIRNLRGPLPPPRIPHIRHCHQLLPILGRCCKEAGNSCQTFIQSWLDLSHGCAIGSKNTIALTRYYNSETNFAEFGR